jgi:hypothetical protein
MRVKFYNEHSQEGVEEEAETKVVAEAVVVGNQIGQII